MQTLQGDLTVKPSRAGTTFLVPRGRGWSFPGYFSAPCAPSGLPSAQEEAVRALRKKRPEGEPDKLDALTRASIELAQARGPGCHQPIECGVIARSWILSAMC